MNEHCQEKQNNKKKVFEDNGFMLEENLLFELIQGSLDTEIEKKRSTILSECCWESLIQIAEKHGVLSLLYEELSGREEIPINLRQRIDTKSRQIVLQQYRLLFLSKFVTSLLDKHDICSVVLKGVTIGAYYPIPELRKSGDVDLLLMNPQDLERAKNILLGAGLRVKEEQKALHHISFYTTENIDVELHTMLAEPFDNEKTNTGLRKLLNEISGQVVKKVVMGVPLPMLSDAYYAFELLLHMLQHFLRSGFGLRLLCDWVVFWKTEIDEKDKATYLELVKRFKIQGFSEIVTQTCERYLGLRKTHDQWMNISFVYPVEDFMREIMDAEEFGKTSSNRMVVLRGNRVFDYVREFHHQMRLNYPKIGKIFIFWPLLWGITLTRFVRNNQILRKTSVKAVLKETARRSNMMKSIKLFK